MEKKGKIVKLLGGFYYVCSEDGSIEETRARGVFRHQNIKPLVGDDVLYTSESGEELSYIEEIFERRNQLIRPPVANVDQVLLFVPTKSPKYNLYLVDKLIAYYEFLGIDIFILISKSDLDKEEAKKLYKLYKGTGFSTYELSILDKGGLEKVKKNLMNKTSALSGVSGAGKSTFTNLLLGKEIETQAVSRKTDRGKHTTRHVELIGGQKGIYLFDTPGFSSIEISDLSADHLDLYFREFAPHKKKCQFKDCVHLNEPHCGVIQAYVNGEIYPSRYENYVRLYEDLSEKEKGKWR